MCAKLIDIEEFVYPDKPYKVTSAQDFADLFSSFDQFKSDLYSTDIFSISLEADIDMEGLEFIPVQLTKALPIQFEGNGHTIKNLQFTGLNATYSGLVPNLGKGSFFKNITFENINATLPAKTSGVLAGYANSQAEITNCVISGKVTFSAADANDIGGVVGRVYGSNFKISDVSIDLEFEIPESVVSAGGFIGTWENPCEMEISNLKNRSKSTMTVLSSINGTGGIIGYINMPQNIKLHDCANYMNIDSETPTVGGIIGYYSRHTGDQYYSLLYNCTNAGNIYCGYGDCGGIAGFTQNLRLYNCVNIGEISSYYPSIPSSTLRKKLPNTAGTGGIVGTYNVPSILKEDYVLSSCINMGNVSSPNDGNIAGIVGYYLCNESNYNATGSTTASKIYPFKNCLSLSSDASNRVVKEFLFNTTAGYNCLGGLYADLSLGKSTEIDSVKYLSNSVLTSGKVPFYYYYQSESSSNYLLDNEAALAKKLEPAFLQKPGYYPYLDSNEDIARLASLPIIVAEGERLDSIASGFTCGMTDGVVWKSEKGTFEVSNDGVATILGPGDDVIYGILGDAVITRHIKVYKNVFGGGRGTAENPYLLGSVAHLEELRDSLDTKDGWSKNKYFKLSGNINGLDFALSTTQSTRFMGSLDGDGYSIKLNINDKNADAALFVMAENATIHDLQTSGLVVGKSIAAGVCGTAYSCDIYNCYNSAKISGAIAGGVVANSNGSNLYGLCNSGTITSTLIAGGVIGKVINIDDNVRISDLVNSGYVNGTTCAGLIGDAEKLSSYAFKRLINYGSVTGTVEAYPYIYTSQFSGCTYPDSHYDIQITRNGKCSTEKFAGGNQGTEIVPTTAADVKYELYPTDINPVYVPSFVVDMNNSELLGIMPKFENDELSSYVQTSPALLSSGRLTIRKVDGTEEFTRLSDLISSSDVSAVLVMKTSTGEERETFITIASIPFKSGDGSSDDPYLINSLDDLKSLAALIEANKVTDKYYVTSKEDNWSYNKHFKLTQDIKGDGTASTIMTEPIGSAEHPFQGVFDGDGHTIKVSINNQKKDNQALFANIEAGAVVENLIVTGVVNGNKCVSGVVGQASNKNNKETPVIRNVINNVNVTASSDYIGGVCGLSDALIEDCANNGEISISFDFNPFFLGGIVGSTSSDLVRCVNTGLLYGHRRVGGICGAASNDKTKGKIKDCINYGMVISRCSQSADIAYIGGIAGSADNFDIETSLNLNRVSCKNTTKVDAIVGSLSGVTKDCYYDKQVSTIESQNGTGLLTSEFSELSIDAFTYNKGMYPTLSSSLSGEMLPKLASSALMLYESDDKTAFDVVTKMMNYGDVNVANSDIKWTSKNGVVEVVKTTDGYSVKPVSVGTDTLTASYGIYSKQVIVDIYCIPVRIDTTITGCQNVVVKKSDGSEIICTNDTTFTEVYKIENSNCDSTIKYIVKVKKLQEYFIDTVLCGKDALSGASYRGNIYTNTEYITREDVVGCDSAITTKLRVVIPRVDSVYYNSGCDSVYCEIDGKYYYETVSFNHTLKSKVCDCDSVYIKVNLNVTNSDGYEFYEVYLDSFEVGGKKLKGGENITIYDTLVTKNGCDSIVKKNIYVYNRVSKMDTILYVCDYYLDNVNYQKITKDTVLIEELSETLHGIKVDGYYLQKRDIRISHNTSADTTKSPDEYYCQRYMLTQNVGGVENVLGVITRDTVVYTNIPRDKKCDSVLARTIHIMPAPIMDTVDVVNCGDYYDATLDKTFTETQNYEDHKKFNNSHCDCDSSITLHRYVIRTTKHNNVNISGCSEAQYTFYGNSTPTIFTTSVDTMEVIRYKSGPVCDSIINNIHIAVANPIYDTIRKSTCGDTIMYGGKVYLASDGDYKETVTYRSVAGCDSLIRHLDFRFVETIENVLPTKYGCDSVVCDINNKVYYDDHKISVEVGVTEQGCPIFNTQSVVVLHPTTTYQEVMGCEFAEFNGEIYYKDTSLQLNLKSTLCDCDSFVNVKILVLPRIESPTIYLSDCDSVVINDPENGEVVLKDDVDDYQCWYKKVFNVAGKDYICDSIVHYNVHVKKPTYNNVVITGESSVVYGGETHRRSKVFRDTLVNAEGCDSFVVINIVVERDLGYPVIVDKFGYTLFCNNNIGNIKFVTYQWYKDGVAIPNATKEYYEGAKGEKLNGCYYVEVTNESGREYVSETYCVDKERELKIYPNPISAEEILTIDYPFTEEEKKNLIVEIYDAMGVQVREYVPSSYPIQIEVDLPSGHYFVLIYESDVKMLDTRFIVR